MDEQMNGWLVVLFSKGMIGSLDVCEAEEADHQHPYGCKRKLLRCTNYVAHSIMESNNNTMGRSVGPSVLPSMVLASKIVMKKFSFSFTIAIQQKHTKNNDILPFFCCVLSFTMMSWCSFRPSCVLFPSTTTTSSSSVILASIMKQRQPN